MTINEIPSVVAGIVLYNPDMDRLKENIGAAVSQADKIILVDNGSKNIDKITETYGGKENIRIIRNGQNLGIAKALNKICACAEELGYKWCLTLDQDSVISENMVSEMLSYDGLYDRTGLLYPKKRDRNRPDKEVLAEAGFEDAEDIRYAITSGSIVNLEAWRAIGGFFEEMFIDCVDFDFNERLVRGGWRVIKAKNVIMLHEQGKQTRHRFCGNMVTVKNYTPFRRYYIARNYRCFMKKYRGEAALRVYARQERRLMVKILLFEKNRFAKIFAMLRGIHDAKSFYKIYSTKY